MTGGELMPSLKATALVFLLAASSASADDSTLPILPGVDPEVILICMKDGKPGYGCGFGCANNMGVVGKTTTSGFAIQKAIRVEMYIKSSPGRTDKHIWVAYRYIPFDDNSARGEYTGYALVASTFTCQWEGAVYGANKTSAKWKVEKFNQ